MRSKLPIGIALTGALLLTSSPDGRAQPDQPAANFCRDFRYIYDSRNEGFAALQGLRKNDRGDREFYPTVLAPHAKFCTLRTRQMSGREQSSYMCAWDYSDKELARNHVDRLANGIRACLVNGGSVSEGYMPEGTLYQLIVFDRDLRTKTQIRVSEKSPDSSNPARYSLFMTIEYQDRE